MPKRKPEPDEVKRQVVEEIDRLVDGFCREHLNEEYAELCRRLTDKLARKRPSPLLRRQTEHLGLWDRVNDWLGELSG